jgi:hypothetical protein
MASGPVSQNVLVPSMLSKEDNCAETEEIMVQKRSIIQIADMVILFDRLTWPFVSCVQCTCTSSFLFMAIIWVQVCLIFVKAQRASTRSISGLRE